MQGGGAERVAALLCNHWVAQRHEVTLIPTFSGRGDCVYPLDARVRLDYLADRVSGGTRGGRSMWRRLLELRNIMREIRPDVVISFLTHVNVAALLAAWGLRVAVIVSERSYPPQLPTGVVRRLLRSLLYRRARRVIAQTETVRDWLVAHCPGACIAVIPNPVALPLPDSGAPLAPGRWLDPQRHLLLAVGRLGAEKGFDHLLEAFARLARDCPDWDLAILGDGDERPVLERQRDRLGLAGRVHLPGRAGNVADWYRRADLYVLSSRYEGFPNTLLEAMAHGVPAVSLDCDSGPRDIIRPEIDGLLVMPASGVEGLAGAMGQLMLDAGRRRRMGKAAAEVVDRFGLPRIAGLWAEALKS
jgi:glycosyltransferase involved in cell wall biosynthesis